MLLLAAIFVIGMIVLVVGLINTDKRGSDLWFEVAKSGLELAVITVFGAVVTAGLRYKEERQARDAERLRAFHNFLAAYNQVKGVRRNLRALGFLDMAEPINAEQASGLRKQMTKLNEAQLLLEAFARANAASSLFNDWPAMEGQIRIAEKYLHDAHERWENLGGHIWAQAPASSLEALHLVKLIGHKHDPLSEFEALLSTPLDQITAALHRELYGRHSTWR